MRYKGVVCLLLSLLVSGIAAAGRGFIHYYQVSADSPKAVHIIGALKTHGALRSSLLSERRFQISDNLDMDAYERLRNTYVTLRVGTDDAHFCVLGIYDGPYGGWPEIVSACVGGLHYDAASVSHPGFNQLEYALHFSLESGATQRGR